MATLGPSVEAEPTRETTGDFTRGGGEGNLERGARKREQISDAVHGEKEWQS
jgi:hypothetical protein